MRCLLTSYTKRTLRMAVWLQPITMRYRLQRRRIMIGCSLWIRTQASLLTFCGKVCHAATFVAPMPTVAAIVPKMSCDGRSVGPFTFIKYRTLSRTIPNGFIGIPLQDVYAINSRLRSRSAHSKQLAGTIRDLIWISTDLAIYHRLHCQNLQVFVAGDIQVEHEVFRL